MMPNMNHIIPFMAKFYILIKDRPADVNIAPRFTIQMAMKWLRKVYNIAISPYALSLGWYFEIFDLTKRDITGCKPLYKVGIPSKITVLNSYEEAVEAALKYTLKNLI